MTPNTGKRRQTLSLADAIAKVCTAARMIEFRENVKPHERERIKEAFKILIEPNAPDALDGKKNLEYHQLLRRLKDSGDAQMVMVCIVGLGRWAMFNSREKFKLQLAEEMESCRDSWDTHQIRSIARECWTEGRITLFIANA